MKNKTKIETKMDLKIKKNIAVIARCTYQFIGSNYPELFTLKNQILYSNTISIMSQPVVVPDGFLQGMPEDFKSNIMYEFKKDYFKMMEFSEVDVVLIDFFRDVRPYLTSLYRIFGTYISIPPYENVEIVKDHVKNYGTEINVFTEEYCNLWFSAVENFINKLKTIHPNAKIIICQQPATQFYKNDKGEIGKFTDYEYVNDNIFCKYADILSKYVSFNFSIPYYIPSFPIYSAPDAPVNQAVTHPSLECCNRIANEIYDLIASRKIDEFICINKIDKLDVISYVQNLNEVNIVRDELHNILLRYYKEQDENYQKYLRISDLEQDLENHRASYYEKNLTINNLTLENQNLKSDIEFKTNTILNLRAEYERTVLHLQTSELRLDYLHHEIIKYKDKQKEQEREISDLKKSLYNLQFLLG